MENGGLWDLIFQVIRSWQVIVATLVILLYIFLVNYVTRRQRRRRPPRSARPKRQKVKKTKAVSEDDGADTSELGLSE